MDLKFERPQLVTEKTDPAATEPLEVGMRVEADAPVDETSAPADDGGGDESWRDEVVSDIFDRPRAKVRQPRFESYNDALNHWVEQRRARELDERARRRCESFNSGAHVCAETEMGSPEENGTGESGVL